MPLAFPQASRATADRLLVVILVPTGSGKTSLALSLASRFGGEIVSCDSVAVYRGMDLGAAKPTPEQRASVPHHVLDVASPDEPYSAGDYGRQARMALTEIALRGALPIVSGGTGLYLRALLDGLAPLVPRSEKLRARLRQSAARHGEAWLHRLLTRLDPASAERIHPNDQSKLIRAIEVSAAARQPMSRALEVGRAPLKGYRVLRLGLEPERRQLYARIDQRAAEMFRMGLVEESRGLLERFGPAAALGALGYRQAAEYLRGETSLEQAIASAQQGHRNYAKRQLTWFRKEPEVLWIRGFGDDAAVKLAAVEAVTAAMRSLRSAG